MKNLGACLSLLISAAPLGASEAIDLLFLIDETGSVSSPLFQEEKNVVAGIANGLVFGPADVQAGLMAWASSTRLVLGLTSSRAAFLNAVNGLNRTGTSAGTVASVLAAATNHLEGAAGRTNATRVIVMFNDGLVPEDMAALSVLLDEMTAKGYRIFPIPFGSSQSPSFAAIARNGGKSFPFSPPASPTILQPFLTALHYAVNNRLLNGPFEGAVGFTSDYSYVPSGIGSAPGDFGVRTNAQDFNPAFLPIADHTTGTGDLLVVDGSLASNAVVWAQIVSVAPHTDYEFSGWVAACSSGNPPSLRFLANGEPIGSDFPVVSPPGTWMNFTTRWHSGASSALALSIVDLTTASVGNDFVLDDLLLLPFRYMPASIYRAVAITWPTDPYELYQVEWTSALDTNTWFNLGPTIGGDGLSANVYDLLTNGLQRFYRVRELP